MGGDTERGRGKPPEKVSEQPSESSSAEGSGGAAGEWVADLNLAGR